MHYSVGLSPGSKPSTLLKGRLRSQKFRRNDAQGGRPAAPPGAIDESGERHEESLRPLLRQVRACAIPSRVQELLFEDVRRSPHYVASSQRPKAQGVAGLPLLYRFQRTCSQAFGLKRSRARRNSQIEIPSGDQCGTRHRNTYRSEFTRCSASAPPDATATAARARSPCP